MKKLVIIVIVVAVAVAAAFYTGVFSRESAQAADEQAAAQPGPGGPGGGAPGGAGGRGARGGRGQFGGGPMTVEVAATTRATMSQELTVVGDLIGDTTVAVVPRTAGRLENVYVKLGDRVNRGQRFAKIEDQE